MGLERLDQCGGSRRRGSLQSGSRGLEEPMVVFLVRYTCCSRSVFFCTFRHSGSHAGMRYHSLSKPDAIVVCQCIKSADAALV